MEKCLYSRASLIVVISEGFRQNLEAKTVPSAKISVVHNWADTDAIRPGSRDNRFRQELGVGDEFLVLYCGALSHNSNLEPVLEAAHELSGGPFRFVIAGDGVRKQRLQQRAAELQLRNLQFLPIQPLDRYPEALAAADATLVTLHSNATFASVPSKIYKQMAAGRPIIAITNPGNELTRLLAEAQCGISVAPDDHHGLAGALRQAVNQREAFAEMGRNGRRYVERNCDCQRAVTRIESILKEVCITGSPCSVLPDTARNAGPRGLVPRLRDLLIASALLFVLSPVFLLCAIAVRRSSPGPIFFRQRRLGLHGRPFYLLKFRSMMDNAPDLRNPDGSAYTGGDDPRVTKIGRFLRQSSLDELPQLLNVLRGEMSLVGPRPDQEDQFRFYSETEKRKLLVKPGLTGLAQISGRNNISWERRKALDVEYVERQSFWLDLSILARTVPYVLQRKDVQTHDCRSTTHSTVSH
jgi:lipopolysaccharide/colanic/teichoic acid biosynthesis glycosyltransferase